MSRSMTGYGRSEATHAGRHFVIEVKSVNSKFCEIKTHCPREFLAWEQEIVGRVREHFTRGRFDVFLQIETVDANLLAAKINNQVAENHYKLLQSLVKKFKLKGDITVDHFMGNKEIFVSDKENIEECWPSVKKTLDAALKKLEEMSRAEAKQLIKDIDKRLKQIQTNVGKVETLAPQIVQQMAAKLRVRIDKLLDERRVDNDRMEQEIAVLADRGDITEEIVRLRSHLGRFHELLANNSPKGRELDFIVQEMHREINTLGQKSQDYGIAELVIQMKSETEKIREQVQNLE